MTLGFAFLVGGGLLILAGIRNRSITDVLQGQVSALDVPQASGDATSGTATMQSGTGVGGGGSPSARAAFHVEGVGTWNGIQVAKWIIPALKWAKAHGGNTDITSGYRPGTDPHTATGRSEHQGTKYPHGAIDFGGMDDPPAARKRNSFLHSLRGYNGPHLIAPQGFHDDGHCSGNGH